MAQMALAERLQQTTAALARLTAQRDAEVAALVVLTGFDAASNFSGLSTGEVDAAVRAAQAGKVRTALHRALGSRRRLPPWSRL